MSTSRCKGACRAWVSPCTTVCFVLALHTKQTTLSTHASWQNAGVTGVAGYNIGVDHHFLTGASVQKCTCITDDSDAFNTAPNGRWVMHVQTFTVCVHCRSAIHGAVKQLMQTATDDVVSKSVLPAAQWVRAAHLLKLAVESVDDEQPSIYSCKESKVSKAQFPCLTCCPTSHT